MTAGWSEEVQTELIKAIDLGRYGQPQEIAAAVRYLVSDAAGFITGATIDINGGLYYR
jgi:NAD(P)-dependent dehydrogenase (short-subunit alcohol dehydrogenase family)